MNSAAGRGGEQDRARDVAGLGATSYLEAAALQVLPRNDPWLAAMSDAQGGGRPLRRQAQRRQSGPTKTARFQATRKVDPDRVDGAKRSLNRYAEPDEIAVLAGPRAKFVNGQVIRIDGASRSFPG